MKLALILGKKQGDMVKSRLEGIKDNLYMDCFEDVPSFIDMALKRNAIYDRVLVLSTKINTKTLKDLNSYWSATNKETEVVMLCKTGVDEEKAQSFLDVFMTPVACAMLVKSTPVSTIAEGVLRPVTDLNDQYGIKDFLDMEVEDDVYIPPEEPKQVEPPKQQQQVQQVQQQNQQQPTKKPEKKKGFFSSLFGSRKPQQPEPVQQQVQQNNNLQQTQINNQVQQNQPVQNNYQDDYNQQYDSTQQQSFEQPLVENYQQSFNNQQYESTQPIDVQAPADIIEDDFSEVKADLAQSVQETYEEPIENDSSYSDNIQTEVPVETINFNVNEPTQSSFKEDSFEPEFEDTVPVKNDFEPEQIEIEDDFGTDLSYDSQEEVHYSVSEQSEIDDDMGNLGVASDEEQYRQQTEQPKVIKQVITKEVIRNVNTGNKLVALNGVYQGRLKKVVIVTGDRGTGVTSTALNIAKTLAKKVDVLYFDCDTDNHGLLSYIDYGNFKNYEQVHMNGVKMCKSTQVFSNCVISWDENMYLLTTDFSCTCSNEDLERASEVVAENADEFGVVVVDCPVDKLPYIKDLVLTGLGVICVEGSRRGFMNMLCQFEKCSLQTRYKRTLVSHGIMLVTKCNKHLDLKKLVNYIKAIYEPDEVNWLAHEPIAFNGKLTDNLLNDILEG